MHLRSLQCQLSPLQPKPREAAQKLEGSKPAQQPATPHINQVLGCAGTADLDGLQSGAFNVYFTLQALQTGAASYLTPEQRFQMGIVRPSHRDEAADHSHALRFTAYERNAAPAAAAGQTT